MKPQEGNFSSHSNLFETDIDRSIRCRACDGFNHIQTQCPNYILKKKMIQTTWSDHNDSSIDNEDIVG